MLSLRSRYPIVCRWWVSHFLRYRFVESFYHYSYSALRNHGPFLAAHFEPWSDAGVSPGK